MPRIYQNALGPGANAAIYNFAVGCEAAFTRSRVVSRSAEYSKWRRSNVIYEHDIGAMSEPLLAFVRNRLPEVLQGLDMPPFDIDSYEVQLTSHNDGEYFRWHTDNGSPKTASRHLTFVYYFNLEPKAYQGGELVLYDREGRATKVRPANDTVVFFPSGQRHEVLPISCPSRRFADGRFTLNGWIHRRTWRQRPDYFDAKIFGPSQGLRPRSPNSARDTRDPLSAPLPSPQTDDLGNYARGMFLLLGELQRQSGVRPSIAVRDALEGADFFREFYFRNAPVLIKGAMRDSPAVKNWSLDYLQAVAGGASVSVTTGRCTNPDYEVNFTRTLQSTTLGAFIERLRREPVSNDYYLVARSHAFANPALKALRSEVRAPGDIINIEDEDPAAVKLWLGPGGTVTPLHIDTHSILFAQIFGRKEFALVPPFEAPSLGVRNRYHASIDPFAGDSGAIPASIAGRILRIEVAPGDLLFLPAGWWHAAQSLDISASATFSSFRVKDRNTRLHIESVT